VTEQPFELDRDGAPMRPAAWSPFLAWPSWAALYEPMLGPGGVVVGHWFENRARELRWGDRKSTRLNSSHITIS